jgi:phosphomannomutase
MLSVSGCRGIVGKTMSPEIAARFAMVVGGFFAAHAEPGHPPLVVLGRDGRAGGDLLARTAAAGLAAAGCDVLDCGVAMTPTIGVVVDARRAVGGLIVTASHNPQEWNGLKVVAGCRTSDGRCGMSKAAGAQASAPSRHIADQIIARYRAAEKSGAPGVGVDKLGTITLSPQGGEKALGFASEATNIHVERVREALKELGCVEDRRWQAIKCVVDSVNASGTAGAKALLGGRIVHHLGSSDSGLFPHAPEPTRDNLATLARFTADKRADVGFAQDPDADRLAIIDEKGAYIGEEYTLALAAEAVLGAPTLRVGSGGVVCVNLSTSRMIEDVAARHGARVVRTAVGEANVVEAMKRENAVFGGEGNGGVIWPRVTYIRDSLSAMGLILALMTRTGKSISQLVADIPSYAIIKRKVDLRHPDDARRAVESVAAHYSKNSSARIDRQDGVWVGLDTQRAWLHVRGSNTEPIMRLIAEAPTEAAANAILDDAAEAISKGS